MEHRKRLDRCLDMILCHDPDVWSAGTGVLLVAPQAPSECTRSWSAASLERTRAMEQHLYDREFRRLQDGGFGFFVRRTLDYRDRMREYWERTDAYLSYHSIDAIERFERGFSEEFEDFSLQASESLKLGLLRHGKRFKPSRSVTMGQSDSHILYRIEHCPCECPNASCLRGLLRDRFPELFDDYDEYHLDGEYGC